jgi:hypothetical protein
MSGVSLTTANGNTVVFSALTSMLAGPDIEMNPQPPSNGDKIRQHAITRQFLNRMVVSYSADVKFAKPHSAARAGTFSANQEADQFPVPAQ